MPVNTGGGTTTSLSNTPQANGETYYKAESDLGIYLFDVMSNDLGGNAKILWSLDDGSATTDLVASDIGENAVSTDDRSAAGAKIWIENGKVRYDATSLPASFLASINALGVGDTLNDTFTYAIRLANGTLAWTTVTITYRGVNDGVVITAGGTVSGEVTEDSGNYHAAGSFGFGDVDLTDTHTVSVTPNGAGYLGTLAAVLGNDSTGDGTGEVSWSFDVDNAALQYLGVGDTLTQTYTVTVDDGEGGSASQVVTITLVGINDGVVINAGGSVAGTVAEDGGDFQETGSFGFSDVDLSDAHTVSVTADGPGYAGSLSAVISDDSTGDGAGQVDWTFNVSNSAIQFLAQGQTVVQTYTVAVDDGEGGSASQTVTITLTGENDGVSITSADDSGSIGEDAGAAIGGTIAFNDVDIIDSHSAVVAGPSQTLGTFALGPVTEGASDASGMVGWTYAVDNAAAQYLAASESVIETYTVTITDNFGEAAVQAVTVTITGTNDGVVIGSGTVEGEVTEDTLPTRATGSFLFGDADLSDAHSVSVAADGPDYLGTLNAVISDAATGDGSGQVNWRFNVDNAALQFLAQGQTLVQSYTLTVDDGEGGSTTETVTITITGTNDAPVVTGAVLGAATEDGASSIVDALDNASDVDAGTTLSVVNVPAVLPPGVSYDPAANSFTLDPTNAAFQSLAAGATTTVSVSYGVSDGIVTTPASVSWTVTGTNDAPVVAGAVTGTAIEDGASSTLDALANASDVDAGNLLSVVGVPDPLPAGVSYDPATNSFTLDPSNAAYQSLAEGATTTVNVGYGVSDGIATTPASVSWIVTGTNDAPVVTGAVTGTATEDGASSTLNALANASDVDVGDLLSVVGVPDPLPAGVSYDPATNSFTLDPTNAAFQSLAAGATTTVSVSYGVSDGIATTPASVNWTVTGTNDVPVVVGVTASTDEDTVYNGAVSGSDIEGEALTYGLAPGESLPDGVTFNANGTFSVVPLASDQALDGGESRVVTFMVVANDGTANSTPQAVTITINGLNDAPVLTAAPAVLPPGSEDNSYTVTQAQLLQGWTDVDVETLTATGLSASNGTVTQNPDGSYTITPATNYFGPVTLNYFVSDGTAAVATSLGYTLTSVNDAAAITGAASGTIVEDAIPNAIGGNLDSTDVDGVNDSWNAVLSAAASANGYGTYTIDASGNWVYTLNSGNAAVNALNDGQSLNDSFTVTTADGTSQVVTITINGHTDFTYTSPPLSSAPDENDFDDLHSGFVAPNLVIMDPDEGPNGANVIEGSNGHDTIYAGNSPDEVYGHDGSDHIYGENGADMFLYGQRGGDFIYGGSGNDRIFGGSGNDTIYGNSDPNAGGASADTIYGGSGRDTIYGQDGDDVINGGNGQDLLTGGLGGDIFVYEKATDTGDFIFDFQQGSDKIDLTIFGFDASSFVGAIAGAGQVGAGEFGYMAYNNGSTTVTTIYVDTDGAYGADMEITLVANVPLMGSDFLI